MPEKIPDDELKSELNSLADLIGHSPSKKEFEQYAPYSTSAYIARYGSWSGALEEAGLEVPDMAYSISRQQLIDDFESVAEKLEKTPTPNEVKKHGQFDPSTYKNHFDSWSHMVDVSTVDPWQMGAGEDHPAWKGGHDEYYGPNWMQKREETLQRDDYECRVCGIDREEHREKYNQDLHVHHIMPARKFSDYEDQNDLDNLLTLCQDCHSKYEGWNLQPDV